MPGISSTEITRIFTAQKEFQKQLRLTDYKVRKEKLKKLMNSVYTRSRDIEEALFKDFRKSSSEARLIEIYNLIKEIKHTIKHLKEWMKPEEVYPPITFLGSSNKILFEPKGVVLIISPWNYPFLLALNPLVSAIAAGNCAVLKPSGKTPHTSALIKDIISNLFEEKEVAVFEGGGKIAGMLLEHNFDHIFFTGGIEVGRSVMKSASENVTSITLELGGKSPAIIDRGADLHDAAQNIVWGKFLNSGQTCVAPDYILVHDDNEEELLKHLKNSVEKFYGTDISAGNSPDLCEIIDIKHAKRIKTLVKDAVKAGAEIKIGNENNHKGNFISPIVLRNILPGMQLMQEEIFGPVLPLVTYKTEEDIYDVITRNPNPLAMYVFSKSKKFINRMVSTIPAGGVTVNGIAVHFANPNLPFGGINNSGTGKYHGYYGFKEFSNQKAYMKLPKWNILKLLYPPYTKNVKRIIDLAVKYF